MSKTRRAPWDHKRGQVDPQIRTRWLYDTGGDYETYADDNGVNLSDLFDCTCREDSSLNCPVCRQIVRRMFAEQMVRVEMGVWR